MAKNETPEERAVRAEAALLEKEARDVEEAKASNRRMHAAFDDLDWLMGTGRFSQG